MRGPQSYTEILVKNTSTRKLICLVSAALLCSVAVACKKDKKSEDEGASEGGGGGGGGLVLNGTMEAERSQTIQVWGTTQSSETHGSGCFAGYLPSEPQLTFTVETPTEARAVATSVGNDLTMVIVGPGGPYCNDDFDGLNPGFQQTWQPGEYTAYVGTYSEIAQDAAVEATATMGPPQEGGAGLGGAAAGLGDALNQLGNSAGAALGNLGEGAQNAVNQLGNALGGNAANATPPNPDATPRNGAITRAAGAAATTQAIVAGGSDQANSMNLGAGCTGLITSASPNVRLSYTPGTQGMKVSVTSETDTTLVIRAPDGTWHCNDDDEGLNPGVTIAAPAAGDYNIWVGTFLPGNEPAGTLTVQEI